VGSGDLTLIQIKFLIAVWSNGGLRESRREQPLQCEIDAPQNIYIKAIRSIPKFYSAIDILASLVGGRRAAKFGLRLAEPV
jgi:hypothetical protein